MPIQDRNKHYSFIINCDQLGELLKKIKDLVSIDNRVVMKIDNKNVFLLSLVGETFKDIHAFKSYIFNKDNIMTLPLKIEEPIILVVKDGKKFYRILENLLDYDLDIHGDISVNEDGFIDIINFDNSQLPIKIFGNDLPISKDINADDINTLLDVEKSSFNFTITPNQFAKIKKISMIENELNSVLYININNKKLSIGETKWKLVIDDIDNEDIIYAFPKKYFNTIHTQNDIKIYVFENFLLCKYDDYNLMIVMEITI